MSTFRDSLKQIKKRPIIFIYVAVVMLGVCFAEQFNSVTKKYGSLKILLKENYLNTLSNFAEDIKNWASTPGIMALSIIFVLLGLLAVSAILGVFGAGHGHTMYMAFVSEKKRKGEFRQGINKHYIKVMFYVFFAVIITAAFLVMIAFAVIPAAMSIKMVLSGDSGNIFMMLGLCAMSLVLIYVILVFYMTTISVIFPAIIAYKKGGVSVAFRMVKSYCWFLISRATLFLLIFIGLQVGLLAVGYGLSSKSMTITVFVLNWIIKTITGFYFMYYTYSWFIGMKEDMFPSYS